MANLVEKYRPVCLEEIVGQDHIRERLTFIRDRQGLLGQAFWLFGDPGLGKTTAGRIIVDTVQPHWDRHEIDAADLNLDTIRAWEEKCRSKPMGCDGWGFLINESHNLRPQIAERLLTTLEKPTVVKNSVWVFTTSQKSLFGGAFSSRLDEFEFRGGEQVVLAWALRLREIAQREGLDGRPLEDYVSMFRRCDCNPRAALRLIGRGEFRA